MTTKKDAKPKIFKKPFTYFLIAGAVIIATVAGILIYNLNTPAIKTEWGKTYYGYIKDHTADDENDLGIIDGSESDMRFIELEGQNDPVMVISHHDDNNNPRANIYFIQNNVVNALIYTQITQVVFLYNISIQKYDYYLHVTIDGEDIYKSLSNLLAENPENNDAATIASDADYVFKDSDTEKITTDEGEELEISEYDKTFIEPEVPENSTPFNPDMTDAEIASAIISIEEKYQPTEEIVNDEVEESVKQETEKITERSTKIQEVKEAQTLTNENVAEKLSENLKWLFAFNSELSSLGLKTVYEFKVQDPSLCQRLGLPKNKFMEDYNCQELVGAGSISNMKNTALSLFSPNVYNQLEGDKILSDSLYDAAGKVYFVMQGGGVGGASAPVFNANTAKVTSGENGHFTVSWPVYIESISITENGKLYKNFNLSVEYKNGKFVITSVQ